jgi:hypothetical protein
MLITESTAPGKLVIQLDFIEPFAARNTSALNLKPEGNSTQVTWSLEGPNNFLSKETMNKSPQMRTPRIGMGCKAKSAAIPEGIASIFNTADRPSSRMCALRGTCSAFP